MKTTRFRRIRGYVSKHRQHNHVFNLREDYSYFLPDFYSLSMQYMYVSVIYDLVGTLHSAKRVLRHEFLKPSTAIKSVSFIEQARSLAKDPDSCS